MSLLKLKSKIKQFEERHGKQLELRRQFNALIGGESTCCDKLKECQKEASEQERSTQSLLNEDYGVMQKYLSQIDDLKQKLSDCEQTGDWL